MENFLARRDIVIADRKSAQERQDEIFRKMSADQKVELGSEFWRLAKDLVGGKISYGKNRPETTSGSYRTNS